MSGDRNVLGSDPALFQGVIANAGSRYEKRVIQFYARRDTWATMLVVVLAMAMIVLTVQGEEVGRFRTIAMSAAAFLIIILTMAQIGVGERLRQCSNFAYHYVEILRALAQIDHVPTDRASIAREQYDEVPAEALRSHELERLRTALIRLQVDEDTWATRRRLLRDLCYRETLIAFGLDDEAVKIALPPLWRRILATWGDFGYVGQTPFVKEC